MFWNRNWVATQGSSFFFGGVFMVLMGWAAWLASGSALLVLPVFVGYITIMQIRAEEQALSAVFGDDYHAYCQRVRRWV